MKRRFYHLIVLATVMAGMAVACQKERPDGMMLVAEGFGDGKAAVEGNHCYWAENDSVRINGVDYGVQLDGMTAYVTGVPGAGTYRALYPNSLNRSASLDGNTVEVTIPSTYVYRKSGDLQVVDVPMAAIGNGSERLYFQHLTAAVTVEIINNFGIDITVDSVVLVSDSYQICGSRTVTLANPIEVPAVASDAGAQKRVTVLFNGGTALTVASDDTAQVQVPVLPVGDGNKFTVKVATHNAGDTEMKYTFERKQTTGGALQRKYIAYASAKFGGVFSVSADKKVRFAPGNLQYFNSTSSPKWRFAQHQKDVVSYDASAYGTNPGKWIDLFGFGTSGASDYSPYKSVTTESSYYHSGNISDTNYDWGWYNAIENGGNANHIWRTATYDEWNYLLNTRTDHLTKIAGGKIGTVKGLIIIPDDFVVPEGLSFTGNKYYPDSYNYYTVQEWARMEVAGAVFLPVTGYRSGTTRSGASEGYYWTGVMSNTTSPYFTAYYIKIPATSTKPEINSKALYWGMAVRLVRNVE